MCAQNGPIIRVVHKADGAPHRTYSHYRERKNDTVAVKCSLFMMWKVKVLWVCISGASGSSFI